MRHALGVLGVIAASVLLVVSAAMNYLFGYSLGKTAWDGQIYGLASAAADCFKALVPFFFFAALRNRMWSQAMAAAVVWGVVVAYSMTSALGHAALNRLDTTGKRAVEATVYKDLRADLKRTEEKLSWLPPHRGAAAVKADMEALKAQRLWSVTSECQEPTGRAGRELCASYHRLSAELGNALQDDKLSEDIKAIKAKLEGTKGGAVMAEADPQAGVLSKLTGLDIDRVQTLLTIFVALLIEIGSGFGMYVAFAYWRMHDRDRDRAGPRPAPVEVVAAEVQPAKQLPTGSAAVWSDDVVAARSEPATAEAPTKVLQVAPLNDNDARALMPPSNVQRFYHEDIDKDAGEKSYITATKLYEAYRAWCKRNDRRAPSMPMFLKDFDEEVRGIRNSGGRPISEQLKVEKHKINGVKFYGIALKAHVEEELGRRQSSRREKDAPTQETVRHHSEAA